MSKAKNEVTTKQNNAPAVIEFDAELDGLLSRAETSDFEVPRLTLIQPTSKLDGNPGDLISSVDGQAVTTAKVKMAFVPVAFVKDFSIAEAEGAKKWLRNEVKSAENAHYSLFDNRIGKDTDGKLVERKERINLFVIKASDLDESFPRMYRMVLKPSSFKEAKKLMSEWDLQIRQRLMPFTYVWNLHTEVQSTEKGKFATYFFGKDVVDGKQRQITPEQYAAVKFWVKTLAQNKEAAISRDVSEDDEHREEAGFEKGKLNY